MPSWPAGLKPTASEVFFWYRFVPSFSLWRKYHDGVSDLDLRLTKNSSMPLCNAVVGDGEKAMLSDSIEKLF